TGRTLRSQASARELPIADDHFEDDPDLMQESHTGVAQEAGEDDRPGPSEGSDNSDDDLIKLDSVEDGVLDADVDDGYDSIDELYADDDESSSFD
ncbi:hypothetical protein DXG01_012838, partial [Tephrocybe rancida]